MLPREPPRFAALVRFTALFFAPLRFVVRFVVRFAALFFVALLVLPRFVLLRFAPPRVVADFLELPRFVALFFVPERFLIAGPRRVLFFPALRFVPRPDFFVAIAASPRRK